jgi:threonine aldolase
MLPLILLLLASIYKRNKMRSFASDNNSGVHPRIMDAIIKANDNHAVGYGEDPWTAAAEEKIKEVFGSTASPFIVFNGTGANSVALQAITRPFNSILCASTAHINVDECGAPARMTGCAFVAIPTPDGKLTPELIRPHLHNFGVCHHSQPKAVYISQVSELGTIYTIDEVRAIADLLHDYDMYLHMDGARLANACAYLNCSMKAVTVDAGVDILSFGGTKNGMMMGESVVSFRPEISANLQYFRKQSAQLASKLRYLSAQFIPYLENNLWLKNAKKANDAALRLASVLKKYPQIHFTQKIESNQLFFTIPSEQLKKLQDKYFFYMWNEDINEARLVTSWDTTDSDINDIAQTLSEIFPA